MGRGFTKSAGHDISLIEKPREVRFFSCETVLVCRLNARLVSEQWRSA